MSNTSLDELIALLEAETARLQANLETLRLTDNAAREQLIRSLVASIDERQTRLDDLLRLRAEMAATGAEDSKP